MAECTFESRAVGSEAGDWRGSGRVLMGLGDRVKELGCFYAMGSGEPWKACVQGGDGVMGVIQKVYWQETRRKDRDVGAGGVEFKNGKPQRGLS